MSRRFFTRRTFLKGAGGVSLALPLLHSLGCSRSGAPSIEERLGVARSRAGFPTRFVVFYTPNGNYELPPSMDLAGSMLEPLAPFADKLLVLDGVDNTAAELPPGEPHQSGMAWLTGRRLNEGRQIGGDGQLAGWASGISIDQEIAKTLGVTTPHRSLQFGVQTGMGGNEVRTVLSYAGSDQPLASESSPYTMFDLVFSELLQDHAAIAQRRLLRRSVLDAVGGQYGAIAKRASAEDRVKLEQHLASIREVEHGLENSGKEVGGVCQVPSTGAPIPLEDPATFGVIGKLQMDLLVMALACDLTRVASLQWSAATNNRPYPFLLYDEGQGAGPQPILGDEHELGHRSDTDLVAWAKLRVIRRWYFEQLAYLLAALDAIPEGDGTMLDNTVVLVGSEVTKGNTHSHLRAPLLLAGGAGYFKMGRYLDYAGTARHNDVFVSLLNAVGVPATTFGDPDFCTGPLTGLTG